MTGPRRYSEAELQELRDRHPCDRVAAQWVTLRRHGRRLIGPCPIHSPKPDAPDSTSFECWADGWVCAVCEDGGDVIKLVQLREHLDFVAAVERLGGVRELDPEEERRIEAERERKRAVAEKSSAEFRERERRRAFEIWGNGVPIAGTAVEAYLALRLGAAGGAVPGLPPGLRLRAIEDMPYYRTGARDAEVIHRGPAMLAPIMRGGRFHGLHVTYIDLAQPKGKLALQDPETGGAREAKKVRGSKKGGHIEVVPHAQPWRLVIGEGIEKVLAVWLALASLERADVGTAFWTSVDLGNLGGVALETVPHPTLKTKSGRRQNVPGPLPALDVPAIEVPDSITEIVILGDATSDRFATECAIARAAARWARRAAEPEGRGPGAATDTRPGRTIKVAWCWPDADFDDVLRTAPLEGACRRIAEAFDAAAAVAAPAVHAPQSDETTSRRQARPQSSSSESGSAPSGEPSPSASSSGAGGAGAAAQPSQQQSDGWTPATLALDVEEKLEDALAACADLAENDVDNGKRLRRYFGRDLLAIAQAGQAVGSWLHWSGTHWEYEGGVAGAHIVAQQLGDLIALEADFMAATPLEKDRIAAAEAAAAELAQLPPPPAGNAKRKKKDEHASRRKELNDAIKRGTGAAGALVARKIARRDFGNQSKNMARVKNMLEMAAPHVRRPPDVFNADPLLVATRTHTLRLERIPDPECPDPDVQRFKARIVAAEEHKRSDLITAQVPCVYDPVARGPGWDAFLDRCMPEREKRRTLQAFSGLGLTGLPIQRLMFHYGSGANGKSVFLEVITRLLGESFAVGLPVESVTGFASGTGAQASPDIARLFGKRLLRVHELPKGMGLKAEVIKKLTGGERMVARDLFKGFFEFQPRAKPHMSGNDPPGFDGSDGGMTRRLIYMHWEHTIPEAEQRDFEELVAELLEEGPAILNWLIAGALDYLTNGLFVADEVRAFTQEQFDAMDPVGQFVHAHVRFVEGQSVRARVMYEAYLDWCYANSIPAMKETRFGRIAKKKMMRDDSKRVHVYVGVELHDLPEPRPKSDKRSDAARDPGAPPLPDDVAF